MGPWTSLFNQHQPISAGTTLGEIVLWVMGSYWGNIKRKALSELNSRESSIVFKMVWKGGGQGSKPGYQHLRPPNLGTMYEISCIMYIWVFSWETVHGFYQILKRAHCPKQLRITGPWFPPKAYKTPGINKSFPGPSLQASTVPISISTFKINNYFKIFINISHWVCIG